MISKLIQEQLAKVEKADLFQHNEEKTIYVIPRRTDIKIEENKAYLMHLKDVIFTNKTLEINWNAGSMPKYKYLKVDVAKIMGKMIKVVSIGYDYENKKDISEFWSGWLPIQDLEVIQMI